MRPETSNAGRYHEKFNVAPLTTCSKTGEKENLRRRLTDAFRLFCFRKPAGPDADEIPSTPCELKLRNHFVPFLLLPAETGRLPRDTTFFASTAPKQSSSRTKQRIEIPGILLQSVIFGSFLAPGCPEVVRGETVSAALDQKRHVREAKNPSGDGSMAGTTRSELTGPRTRPVMNVPKKWPMAAPASTSDG